MRWSVGHVRGMTYAHKILVEKTSWEIRRDARIILKWIVEEYDLMSEFTWLMMWSNGELSGTC
jgi:hypothetical protein